MPKISRDWYLAVDAMRMFGASVEDLGGNVHKVSGVSGKPQTPDNIINVRNSGTMLFFIAGVAAAGAGLTVITGDESIRTLRRVSQNLFRPFKELGVTIISTKNDGMAPLIIQGPVNGGVAHMDGIGCQPVFSVLIASALSSEPVDIFVENPGETAYIETLLFWFKKVGIQVVNVDGAYTHYHLSGNNKPEPFDVTIPLEWSAPSYPLLAGLITKNSVTKVRGMDRNDTYGDKLILDIFRKMGGDISIKDYMITARSSLLHASDFDMNLCPDQVPTVAVAACFAQGVTNIHNAKTARWKECDRISAICTELKKMGAKIHEKEDGMIINQDGSWKLRGCEVQGFSDHRMVLSLAVAGLKAEGKTVISDAETVEKSFETFVPDMVRAGARYKFINTI
jgi:3-phosphoshikimate 1-carboxyvinyltransferase